jgi:hypothetical protein
MEELSFYRRTPTVNRYSRGLALLKRVKEA